MQHLSCWSLMRQNSFLLPPAWTWLTKICKQWGVAMDGVHVISLDTSNHHPHWGITESLDDNYRDMARGSNLSVWFVSVLSRFKCNLLEWRLWNFWQGDISVVRWGMILSHNIPSNDIINDAMEQVYTLQQNIKQENYKLWRATYSR